MSVVSDTIGAIKEAMKLAEDVKRTGDMLKEVAQELREHDRRLTRLEAKWEAAMELATARAGVRRLEGS